MSHGCCSSSGCETSKQAEPASELQVIERCPVCGEKGKQVGLQTVQSMLAVSLEVLAPGASYRFCRSPSCEVVYFDEAGGPSFTEAELREKVYQKHPEDDDVFVCYCYRHTPGSIRAELVAQGETDVVERVTAGTKAGSCACDLRNPQGSCCLGHVRVVVKKLRAECAED